MCTDKKYSDLRFLALTSLGLAISIICVMAGGGRNGLYCGRLMVDGGRRRTLQPLDTTACMTYCVRGDGACDVVVRTQTRTSLRGEFIV